MAISKIHPCVSYGIGHSKCYKPSVVSSFLVDTDDDGRLVKVHSDVHLLLHQKNLDRDIGIDVVRDYFDSISRSRSDSMDTSILSDDDLFSLIPPKAVDNLTTRYEYSCYLKEHEKELKERYDQFKAARDKETDLERWFKKNFKSDNSDKSD